MTVRTLDLVPRALVALLAVGVLGACADDPAAPASPAADPLAIASASANLGTKVGGKIAFINRIGLDQWLYVMNADGSDIARVSNGSYAYEADPTWSPDYKSVLYIDYYATNALKRYTLANGRVETVYSAPGSITNPRYSPDGRKIAFDMEGSDGNRDIYVVGADGTNLTRLTTDPYVDRQPTWSPDGKRIAFVSWRSAGVSKLYIMNFDGSGQQVLHDCLYNLPVGHCDSPSWSPLASDERVAFSVNTPGYHSVRLINADGTGDQAVINDATVDDKQPVWSRDGTKLAFRSKIAGTSYPDIYSINVDGTGLRQLTGRIGDALSPAWAR